MLAFAGIGDWPLWLAAPAVAAFIALRYLLIAGGAYWLVTRFAERLAPRRIQPVPFRSAQLRREIAWSALSAVIFASVAIASATLGRSAGLTQVYTDPSAHSWLWLAASLPVVVLIHDTYFYWTHRLLHLPGLFERFHAVHHRSTNPSPFAALAFHPVEAVIQAGAVVVVTMLVPVHFGVLAAWALYTLMTNVMGHLGYELLPAGLARHPLFGWINTATSHNQHHRTCQGNYGLFTLIWDRMMGTRHRGYVALYERVTGRGHKETHR